MTMISSNHNIDIGLIFESITILNKEMNIKVLSHL